MKLIKQGAEAKLYLGKHGDQDAVTKDRVKKSYRIQQIDEKVRKLRTTSEANLLSQARRAGVLTPKILEIDKKNNKLVMEYVEGERIKEIFSKAKTPTIRKLSFEIGRLVGKLHSAGIIHGDLTTSNLILHNNDICLIDFGLGFFSKKIEDQGVDLKLLREALKSTHFKILDITWDNILKGYKKEYKDANLAIRKVEEIERRARYSQREGQT